MANQIADFFRSQPDEAAVEGSADHIRSYWNPVMRREIYAYMDAGGAGLNDLARRALDRLRSVDPAAPK
ncbi:MAG: formate dehydrogenase subunit delta [Beijerinckiaceae bacterium]